MVNNDVTINGKVALNGDVHLIICDGKMLTIEIKGDPNEGINAKDFNFTVHGQRGNQGKIVAVASTYRAGIQSDSGEITINGVNVKAKGYHGIKSNSGAITIHDSTVEATASNYGTVSSTGNVIIIGGNVTAKGDVCEGLSAGNDLTLSNCVATVTGPNNGLHAKNNATFINATVDVTGESDGIWISNGNLTINGGRVTGRGNGSSGVGIHAGGSIDISSDVLSVKAFGKKKAIEGTVKNAIPGIGWTDTAGTTGRANIGTSNAGQTLTYKKVQFPVLDPSEITQVPTAKTDLKSTGSAQKLITAGAATGGTMYYALGENATVAPAFDGESTGTNKKWNTSIPTATDAGT